MTIAVDVSRQGRLTRLTTREWVAVGLFAVVGVGAPFLLSPLFLMYFLCYALFAAAYNLLFGYVGLLAFGHAAFFGSAAYVAAYTTKFWGLTPELAILLATLVSAVLGAIFGWVAIRRQGLYFAMITLALAEIVYFYALQAPWTRGEDGIQAVPRGHAFGLIDLSQTMNMYAFTLIVFAIGYAIIYRTIHSPFGEILRAIRENEPRAISLGYDADQFKLIAFTLSAALSGTAGATNTLVFQIATLDGVQFNKSGDALLMVLIGGIGTAFGPIVGAGVLVSMQQFLAPFGSWVTTIQGAVFVACVLLLRRGIVGTLGDWFGTRFRHRGRDGE